MMRPDPELPVVYLCVEPVDFRRAIQGLSLLVEQELELNPFEATLFVFINRRRDKLKILYWEKNGFCLWYIGSLLRAAYQREFTMLDMGKCKTKYPAFDDWYATLDAEQRRQVDAVQVAEMQESETTTPTYTHVCVLPVRFFYKGIRCTIRLRIED